jgi:hypothetical protein
MAEMHLIRFPNRKEHKRALMTLLQTPHSEFVGLPGLQMVVTSEQIKALEAAKVAFTYLSKTAAHGAKGSPVQS